MSERTNGPGASGGMLLIAAILMATGAPAIPQDAAGKDHPATATAPTATSAPATMPAVRDPSGWFRPELARAARAAAKEKDWTTARKILRKLQPEEKNNPLYYLVYGHVYALMNRHVIAATAFRQAIHLEGRLVEAYLHLAISYHQSNRSDKAVDVISRAVRLAPDDTRFNYVEALILCSQRRWDLAIANLEAVAKGAGPIAGRSSNTLQRLKRSYPPLKDLLDRKAPLVEKLAEVGDALSESKTAGRNAVDERKDLRRAYDTERKDVDRDYRRELRGIDGAYRAELPPASLEAADPTGYARRVADAVGRRDARYRQAKRDRNDRLSEIDRRYRRKVADVDARIAGRAKEVRRLSARKTRLTGQVEQLRRQENSRAELILRDLKLDLLELQATLGDRLREIRPAPERDYSTSAPSAGLGESPSTQPQAAPQTQPARANRR